MRALALLLAVGCGRIGFSASDDAAVTEGALPPGCRLDTFDSLDTSFWREANGLESVNVAVINGRLELSLTPFVNEYDGLATILRHPFEGLSAEVELVQRTDQVGGTETTMEVDASINLRWYMITQQDGIQFQEYVDQSIVNETSDTFRPADHRYLRIRHDAPRNMIVWQTSGDRVTWVETFARPAPASPINIRVFLYVGQWGAGSSTPGTGIFDNFRFGCP